MEKFVREHAPSFHCASLSYLPNEAYHSAKVIPYHYMLGSTMSADTADRTALIIKFSTNATRFMVALLTFIVEMGLSARVCVSVRDREGLGLFETGAKIWIL